MPAPGNQHVSSGGRVLITNPFEEAKPRISEYTAQEIMTLQSRLEKQLGPEYISTRAGPGGQKVHYLAAEKCIQLANEVFGFNGWSSQIKEVQVDFVEENPQTLKVSLGLSVIVRVTLRDGTFHEDIGYGHMENCKGKAAAFEKAKKEGTTDALKRALRSFGNVLGNCIYDKEYLQKVIKVKTNPTKWDADNLHRHHSCAPTKKALEIKLVEEKPPSVGNGGSNLSEDTFDDEFGDFDEADFSVADPEAHPDEVVLPGPSHHLQDTQNNVNSAPNGRPLNQQNQQNHQNQPKPPINRQQPMVAQPNRPQNAPGAKNNANNTPAQPQTPNAGLSRSISGAGRGMQPPQNPGNLNQSKPITKVAVQPIVTRRVINQLNHNGGASGPVSPVEPHGSAEDNTAGLPPPGTGFFSAKAAAMLPPDQAVAEGAPLPIPAGLPVFNPHAESPSIRKTSGFDHKSSKPTNRDLKHVPASQTPAAPGVRPGNIVNPQLDQTRRIGAPNSPSPMGNRGAYKPPSKRPVDSRAPLHDLNANEPIGHDISGDAKRQRING